MLYINILYDELIMLLDNKVGNIDNKVYKIYNEKFYKLKNDNIFLKDEILNTYHNYILNKFNFEEDLKLELRNINEIIFPKESSINDKNDIKNIFNLMKDNENEIYLIYYDELKNYKDLYDVIIKYKEKLIKSQKEFVIKFEIFNYKQELNSKSFDDYLNKIKEQLEKNIKRIKRFN